MGNKEKIMELEARIQRLEEEKEYYKEECNSYWAELRKRQALHLDVARRIVRNDSKAVANIILNMYFGKMPSDSVGFCDIFDLHGKGRCKEGERCTDCIDGFLRGYYQSDSEAAIAKQLRKQFQEGINVDRDGDDESDYIRCPVCSYEVASNDDSDNIRPKHCPECGTKLLY